jgi:hypothetical protein
MANRVNLSKSKLFGAVTCLKISVVEFSHPLDQSSQARCHLRLSPLVINEQRKHMYVHPLRGTCISTKNHLWEEPLQELLKVASM